jgi:HEAT repeat protein
VPLPFLKKFRSWLKNPSERQGAVARSTALYSLAVPQDISTAEIQKMVDRLFIQADDDFNFERLKLVGAKAIPSLIEVLGKTRTSSVKFTGQFSYGGSPFQRICDLLGRLGAAEAAGPLAKYVEHRDAHFRQLAALALGSIGTPECIPPMTKALKDDDDYVRSYAMMGVTRGIEAGSCTKDFLNAMFTPLVPLLNRRDGSVSGDAPKLLLRIDAHRALSVLLSPAYFTAENSELHSILHALNASRCKISHDRLLPLLAKVKPLSDRHPHDYQYAEALRAYAHNPDPAAEAKLRAELNASNNVVRVGAAEALAILSGIVAPRGVVFNAVNDLGFDALTPPQQVYFAVLTYDSEVCNGGHAQYFVNSSGENWRIAMDGLMQINADERRAVLQAACELFGSAGPSEDSEQRHCQIAEFSTEQDEALGELDTRYYSCDENVESLLAQFTLAHREHFRTPGNKVV